jgi:hypothetical protein
MCASRWTQLRNTTPHAINVLVWVKKASFLTFSTNPYGLAHTGSLRSNNGCARVAGAQSWTCASANMQECACIIQGNGLGRQAAKGAVQHVGKERCKSWYLVDGAAGRQQKVQNWGLVGRCMLQGTWGVERAWEQTTKRVACEPSEGNFRVTG